MIGKKILVTGKSGMLGSSLMDYFKQYDIVGLDSDIDISHSDSVCKKLEEIDPDIIIHTAAYTDVESCETNIDMAYSVNTVGTQNIVNYCIGKDVLFIYISSTGIYGISKDEAYNEFDDVDPTTLHHKSKYEAEKVIKNHLGKYLILRTGWLYGGKTTHRKNFVYKRYLEAIQNSEIYSDDSQTGNPTYVVDLIEQIKELVKHGQYGLFNCVNEADKVSRYDYVKKIIELFDLKCNVKVASEGMFKRIAPVSKNESAINYKLDLLGLNIMPNWEISLEKYILQLKSEI